tara:strand:- start:4093 stop:5214 length:1122 start_codon:yes stop_codon:yes gene_type:complete
MALNYDSLSALTRDKFLPVLVDNIFQSNPLTLKLLKGAEKLDGGKKIITPIEYGKNSAQGFYSGYDVLDTTPSDPITAAEWNWKQAFSTITISGEEELKNSGDSQVLSLLKSKMKNAEKSLKDLFGSKLFANAAPGANEITSLLGSGVADDVDCTTATAIAACVDAAEHDGSTHHAGGNVDNCIIGYDRSLGGINSDTYAWWDAKFASGAYNTATPPVGGQAGASTFNGITATNNGVALLVKKMTQMYGALTIDNDSPDMIVVPQVIFDAYETSLQPSKRFEGDATLADAGFQTLKFKGATVVVDSHCPAGHMVFLNTKYLDFKVHSKRNFSFENFMKPINQDARVAKIFWMGQLVCTNPRMQGAIVGLPIGY